MSNQLTPSGAHRPSQFGVGRRVAAAELRTRILIGDINELVDALSTDTENLVSPTGEINLSAYRARVAQVDAVQHDLTASVDRLTELILIGADTLLITVGKAICDTLSRILESAEACAVALEDGA